MVSTVIKNWDKDNWLSSKSYISDFNLFLTKIIKLDSTSQILDIGCGRGKIIGSLSSKLKLKVKPIGIDLVNHKDKDKRVNFKKIDAISFFLTNKKKFDLILIKQTIHLFSLNDTKSLLLELKKHLNPNGKILIFMINPYNNEFPQFSLMKKKFSSSLKRQIKISKIILDLYPKRVIKNFSYKVRISRKKYNMMILKRFMSILINLREKQILSGIDEINAKYQKNLRFNDKLICLILKK